MRCQLTGLEYHSVTCAQSIHRRDQAQLVRVIPGTDNEANPEGCRLDVAFPRQIEKAAPDPFPARPPFDVFKLGFDLSVDEHELGQECFIGRFVEILINGLVELALVPGKQIFQ